MVNERCNGYIYEYILFRRFAAIIDLMFVVRNGYFADRSDQHSKFHHSNSSAAPVQVRTEHLSGREDEPVRP